MLVEPRTIAGVNEHETRLLYEEIFLHRTYARQELQLGEGSTVFDVGANIGVFSLFIHVHHPAAQIYCFEPVKPLYEKLQHNLRTHGVRAKAFNVGLSDVSRAARFQYYPGYSVMSGELSYADTAADLAYVKKCAIRAADMTQEEDQLLLQELDEILARRFKAEAVECQLERISDIIVRDSLPEISLLKIDVQRAELDVLNGVDEEHWKLIKAVIVEVHDGSGSMTSGRVGEVVHRLTRHGFKIEVFGDERVEGSDRHTVHAVK